MSFIYWIHLEEHTDIDSEGYVGVAMNFELRLQKHYLKTSKGDTHFGRAIRLYGWKNLVKTVVFEGSDNDCYALEMRLRPRFQIGWNEAIGGFGGDKSAFINYALREKPIGNRNSKQAELNPFFNKKHSEESKKLNSRAQARSLIKTPYGDFYGFNALAKYLNVHKATAKKQAIKEGWQIECKPKLY